MGAIPNWTCRATGGGGWSRDGAHQQGSRAFGGSVRVPRAAGRPLQGDNRAQSESVVNGEKLALQEAGGKVGKYAVKYVSLDDSTAATGKWEPGATSSAARK